MRYGGRTLAPIRLASSPGKSQAPWAWRGLNLATFFGLASRDLLGGITPVIGVRGSAETPAPSLSKSGRTFRYQVNDAANTSTGYVSYGTPSWTDWGSGDIFLAVYAEYIGGEANIRGLIGRKESGGTNPGFGFWVNNYQTEDRSLIMGAGPNEISSGTGLVPFNEPFFAAAIRRGNTAELWFNDQLVTTTSVSGDISAASGHQFYIGSGPDDPGDPSTTAAFGYDGHIYYGLGGRRAPSHGEIKALANDPFAPFRPRPLLIPVSGTAADVTGSGSVQAQSATATGTGIREVTGSGTPQAQDATATATGERKITGSGTPSAQAATASGTGEREVTGSATVQSQDATATGSGGLGGEVSGSGSASAQDATATGSGSREIVISAAVQARDATASGTGEREITGSATVQSQSATASGTDIVEVIQNRLPPHLGQSRLYRYLKS